MPTILIFPVSSLDEIFASALEQARCARAEIIAIVAKPLAHDETIALRAVEVSRHAIALADAFGVIDEIANQRRDVRNDSPSQTAPSDPQGCVSEDSN